MQIQHRNLYRRVLAFAWLSFAVIPAACHADTQASTGQDDQSATSTSTHQMGMQHHQMMLAELQKLGLSQNQWQKIKTLDASFAAAHPDGQKPTHAEARAHQKQMLSVLTPQQRDQFRQDMANMRAAHQSDTNSGDQQH